MKNNRAFATPGLALVCAAVLLLAACASNSPAPVTERAGQSTSGAVPVVAAKNTYTVKSGDTVRSIAREFNMDFRELIAMNNIESPDRITPGRVLKIKPAADQSSAVASTAPIATDVVVARPIGNDPVVEKRPLAANTESLKREPKAGKEAYSDQALAQAQNQAQPKPAVLPAAEAKPDVSPDAKPAEAAQNGNDLAWVWPANGNVVGVFGDAGKKGLDIAGKAGDPVLAGADGKISYTGTGLPAYGKLVVVKHNSMYMSVYAHNQTILVKEGQIVSKGQKIAEMGNSGTDQVMLHFEIRRQPTSADTPKPVDPLQYLPKR